MKIITRSESEHFKKQNPYIYAKTGSKIIVASIATPTGRISKYLFWYVFSGMPTDNKKLKSKLDEWLNVVELSLPDNYKIRELISYQDSYHKHFSDYEYITKH